MIFFFILVIGIINGWFPWYVILLELFLWVPDLTITVFLIGLIISLFHMILR